MKVANHPKPEGATARSSAEHRRCDRQSVATVGLLFEDGPNAKSSPIQVLIRDVSLKGVGFRSAITFAIDTLYRCHIGVGPLHMSGRLRIVWCNSRPDGTFDVGGEFY